jgi:transposase
VAAYCGLTSTPYNSGATIRDQGISRTGNRRARCAAVELAWLWLRYQPESRLSRWFHERVGEARGRFKRIMIVALARKLMMALWRYLASGIVPEDAAVKA